MDYPGKVITKTQVTPTQTSASGNWTLDDQAAAIKNNNWPVALVPNPISKSLRFNSADSAYLNRTPASASNRKTWTWSGWVKRSTLGGDQKLFQVETTNGLVYTDIKFSSDIIYLDSYGGTSALQARAYTNAVYRDVGAWYHLVVVLNTPSATAADRAIIYVNGVRQAVTISDGFDQDAELLINTTNQHRIGADVLGSEGYFGGYLTEINFIDGQALTPSDFGLTNPQTGQWIPKKYTGTYGTNGFYLNFKDATSTTTLGYDYSGNANNWTTNNFSVTAGSGNDSLTDVPTPWVAYNTTGDVGGVVRGNYCTLNPLNSAGSTLSNGNLDCVTAVSGGDGGRGTIAVTSGKWYWEFVPTVNGGQSFSGIALTTTASGSYYVAYYANTGNKFVIGSGSSAYGATYTTNDVIGVALDLDSGTKTVTFYKNNVSQGSITITPSEPVLPIVDDGSGSASTTFTCNFGQRPFAYTPPSGFRSLCTTNLPASTVLKGGDYFNAVTYTGTGSTNSITGVGFQPDLVWLKSRSNANDNNLYDIVRGISGTGSPTLLSNLTDAETTYTGFGVSSLNSDGFTVIGNGGLSNGNGLTYVGWNWKANGAGVTNTAGTITSTVSANTTSGFSIVTYTGTGANATVGHGLGVAPSMIIVKNRSSAQTWRVYSSVIGATQYLNLNATTAAQTSSIPWNNTAPTSTVFSVGTDDATNKSSENLVAYCFAAVAGYSAFGSYTGNGSADGPFVYLGFRPRYVLVKPSSTAGSWIVMDTARSSFNVADDALLPNSSSAELYNDLVDINSNGFKIRKDSSGNMNNSGATYIYAAFAESPFQFSNAR
jgi:hypothetical protein